MKRVILLCAFVMLCLGHLSAQEENVWFVVSNNQEYIPYDEMDFILCSDENGEMAIATIGGQLVQGVRNIKFTLAPSSVNTVKNAAVEVSVYPNPVVSQLSIKGLREETSVSILAVDGTVLMNTILDATRTTLDVSSLSTGIYLLQVKETIVKFIKK